MKIQKGFPDYFREIQVRFSRFYARSLNRAGLSISQYALLNQLSSSGTMPMSEVGKKLHVTKPAVTHLVDCLEKKRFVRRSPHPTDRRVSLIKISEKGAQAVRRIQESVLRIVYHALHKFSKHDQETIVRYQSLISHSIDDILNKTENRN